MNPANIKKNDVYVIRLVSLINSLVPWTQFSSVKVSIAKSKFAILGFMCRRESLMLRTY